MRERRRPSQRPLVEDPPLDPVQQMEISAAERRELEELRATVLMYQQTLGLPQEVPEEEPAQRMMAGPVTLTAGGIQYAVEITTKE